MRKSELQDAPRRASAATRASDRNKPNPKPTPVDDKSAKGPVRPTSLVAPAKVAAGPVRPTKKTSG